MRRMVYSEIKCGDRVRLKRERWDWQRDDQVFWTYPAVSVGTVTFKCQDGLSGAPQVRVHFDGHVGEPFFSFPCGELEYSDQKRGME